MRVRKYNGTCLYKNCGCKQKSKIPAVVIIVLSANNNEFVAYFLACVLDQCNLCFCRIALKFTRR